MSNTKQFLLLGTMFCVAWMAAPMAASAQMDGCQKCEVWEYFPCDGCSPTEYGGSGNCTQPSCFNCDMGTLDDQCHLADLVAPDGSGIIPLVPGFADARRPLGEADVDALRRACDGAIVLRFYSASRQAQLRRASQRLVL